MTYKKTIVFFSRHLRTREYRIENKIIAFALRYNFSRIILKLKRFVFQCKKSFINLR